MKKILSLLILTLCLNSLAIARDIDIEVWNKSDFSIYNLYISPTSETNWGIDHLDDKVLSKNQSFMITEIPEGVWDFKLIDEDGDVCIVAGVDIGNKDFTWVIYNDSLLECQGFGN